MIRVRVEADARKDSFIATSKEGEYTATVREPAERNQANVRVRELVAQHFRVPLSSVRIETGHRSKVKKLRVSS